jgi:hypothetical protein
LGCRGIIESHPLLPGCQVKRSISVATGDGRIDHEGIHDILAVKGHLLCPDRQWEKHE